MKTSDFYFDLPEELVAQHPAIRRDASRLMVLNPNDNSVTHHMFPDIVNLMPPGTLLVYNDSRVRKARVPAHRMPAHRMPAHRMHTGRKTGPVPQAQGSSPHGGHEFLFVERIADGSWKALVKKSRTYRQGDMVLFPEDRLARVTGHEQETVFLFFEQALDEAWFERNGSVPLPPYIRRKADEEDTQRYQTVYAKMEGSVAAPTAGLHFTPEILAALKARSIDTAAVTLHVGPGTFLPVRAENLEDHVMHSEQYSISEEAARKLNQAISEGRKICAVGTTSVRTLESAVRISAADAAFYEPCSGETGIFIYPGFRFRVIDMLLTNFHTPESSLLMLVSAFAGTDLIRRAYAEAVKEKYRFFSYGDAMLITSSDESEPRCRRQP